MECLSNPFRQTKKQITRVGLGGEGILRTTGMADKAVPVITAAIEQGITYCDSARVYKESECYYGEYWKAFGDRRESVFQTSKSASRTREGALKDLTQSLDRLNTDYLDLWQIHDVRDENDLRLISQKGGALEAFVSAKETGRVKHIGVTGHHDPLILTKAVESWPVDAVLMPVNPVEEIIGGFLTRTLEAAHKKNLAVIGMKVLGGKHYIAEEMGITAGLLVRFALSHEITLAIVGCSSEDEVAQLVKAGSDKKPLTSGERKQIMNPYRESARQLAYYRGRM